MEGYVRFFTIRFVSNLMGKLMMQEIPYIVLGKSQMTG